MKVKKAVLVYQAGIANVFSVDCFNASPFGRNANRLMQASFSACEFFARGLGAAGASVASMWCNEAGDITESKWNHYDLYEAPFFDSMKPVFVGVKNPDELTVQTAPGEVCYLF